jgi:hypothetical protein
MGIKENMMRSMMEKMSAEEKTAMMEQMMTEFFAGMTSEEKQEMMKTMMPKMMGEMMGGAGGSSMMGMMGSMCCGDEGPEGFNPMEMCHNMMSSISQSNEMAAFATPEIRGLFEEWVQQLDLEVLEFVKTVKSTDPEALASYLKLSKESAIYLLSRLAQKGTISIAAKFIGNE